MIIPAHNEEAVIARCLSTALADRPAGYPIEVIVAANGCSDRTVQRARDAAPHATILDLPDGSKTSAINAAIAAASITPCVVLDADVECNFDSLRALAEALTTDGVMTASPRIRMDLMGLSLPMKAYCNAWLKTPFAKAGEGGSGCYGLSAAAINQIGGFPDIIADDFWVQTRFTKAQKRLVTHTSDGQDVYSIVRPPRTMLEQIKVEARRQAGNAQVRALHPMPRSDAAVSSAADGGLLSSGLSLFELLAYGTVKVAARALKQAKKLKGSDGVWVRDLSSRGQG